jgi:hypothetical protein
MIAKVGCALQQLLGEIAESVAEVSPIILRQRKFTAVSLARTFVLGFLQNPAASDEQLAQVAAQCGASVTPQAIEQRHTLSLVHYLEALFRRAITIAIGSNVTLTPLLNRFTRVTVLDSSVITLPDSERKRFPGCGGPSGSGQAALKLQTELDLRSGAIEHIEIEVGKSPDAATTRQHAERPAGSLRITDLGYFNIAVFAALLRQKAYVLSRLQFGTGVLSRAGETLDLLAWLARQPTPLISTPILLGKKERLPCCLVAWRLPPEQANRRRQRLRQEALSKRGRAPCKERLAWCDWTMLITTVPKELLNGQEAIVLYRARWQVELLFKRWKSQGLVDDLSGSTDVRKMVRVWSRLIAVVIQHWLVAGCLCNDPRRSLTKACEAVRQFVPQIIAHLNCRAKLLRTLELLTDVVGRTCRLNRRSKPGTVDLLNDCQRLDFRLT